MAECYELPPIVERLEPWDAYSNSFRASYLGRLTAVEYRKGFLTAMFGRVHLFAKLDRLPEWLKEGCEVDIEVRADGVKISPFYSTAEAMQEAKDFWEKGKPLKIFDK